MTETQLDEQEKPKNKNKKYRRDKPWDNDPTIDKWKIPEIAPGSIMRRIKIIIKAIW